MWAFIAGIQNMVTFNFISLKKKQIIRRELENERKSTLLEVSSGKKISFITRSVQEM